MENTIITDENTEIEIIELPDNKGIQLIYYLGGNTGRFLYERIVGLLPALYIAIMSSIIATLYISYEKINSPYRTLITVVIVIAGLYITFKLVPKYYTRILKKFLQIWNKFARNQNVTVLNLSNTEFTGKNKIYKHYQIPPSMIQGLDVNHININLIDILDNELSVRGNGKFDEEAKEKLSETLIDKLQLKKLTSNISPKLAEYNYINPKVVEMDKKTRIETANNEGYNLRNQADFNIVGNNLYNIMSFLFGVFLFILSMGFGGSVFQGNLSIFSYITNFFLFAFFGIYSIITVFQNDFLGEHDSAYL